MGLCIHEIKLKDTIPLRFENLKIALMRHFWMANCTILKRDHWKDDHWFTRTNSDTFVPVRQNSLPGNDNTFINPLLHLITYSHLYLRMIKRLSQVARSSNSAFDYVSICDGIPNSRLNYYRRTHPFDLARILLT